MRSIAAPTAVLALALSAATPALAQEGLPARGHVRSADGVVVFEPCGSVVPYALSTAGEVGNEVTEALETARQSLAGGVFVDMLGWMDSGPIARAEAAFAGTFAPTGVVQITREEAADCAGAVPPLWLRPPCPRLHPPDLDCLPTELAEADLRLARYVTAALEYARYPGEVTVAHAAWKRTRDLRCAETRPGGTVDEVWVLACRLGMSRARLRAVWEDYLREAPTDLPAPPLGE